MVKPPSVPAANDVGDPRALRRKLIVFAVLSVVFAVGGAVSPLRRVWTETGGVEFVRHLGVWAPLAILAAGALAPFAFLPRWPLAVACGALYGLAWGGLLANTASTLGAWLQFRFARRALSSAAARVLARSGRRLPDLPPRKAVALLVALRAFPLSNFVVTNLLAASLDLSPTAYVWATFAGMVPSTLMYGAWGRLAVQPRPGTRWIAAGVFLCVGVAAWIAKGRLARPVTGQDREEPT